MPNKTASILCKCLEEWMSERVKELMNKWIDEWRPTDKCYGLEETLDFQINSDKDNDRTWTMHIWFLVKISHPFEFSWDS